MQVAVFGHHGQAGAEATRRASASGCAEAVTGAGPGGSGLVLLVFDPPGWQRPAAEHDG
jgi:hypothetical protein